MPVVVSVCAIALCFPGSFGRAQGIVLKGQILDGVAGMERISSKEKEWKVPLKSEDVRLELVGGAAGKGGATSWTVKTDKDGLFSQQTNLSSFPEGSRLVASVPRRGWYSASHVPDRGELKIHVYPTTDDPVDTVQYRVFLIHDVVEREGVKSVRVRLRARLINLSGFLYVGERGPSKWREILRVPIPRNARLTENVGSVPGTRWKRSSDGRSLIIDEPVPGYPDLLLSSEDPLRRWRDWEIEYLLAPSQYLSLYYSFPAKIHRFEIYALQKKMKVTTSDPSKLVFFRQSVKDPLGDSANVFDCFVPSPGAQLEAGQRFPVIIEVDNRLIDQVDRGAVQWHGAFVLLAIFVILVGLLFGPRRPPGEVALAGLSSEEILDRIAELDVRFERGKIKEAEYRRYRGALLEIAAEELEGGAEAPRLEPTAGKAAPTRDGAVLPPEVKKLVARIQELEKGDFSRPEAIQERAHLLEALYKLLRQGPST